MAIMEVGLFFNAEAELTGEAGSALMLLFGGWGNDDDDDGVWGAAIVAALG